MKTILTAIFSCLICNMLQAQNVKFVTNGVIEYNKSINMYAIMQKGMTAPDNLQQQVIDQYKKTQPQFLVLKSSLSFSDNKALFEPVDDQSAINYTAGYYSMVRQYNIVYSDLKAKTALTQKNILGEQFLIKDVLRPVKWKITNETREIAGYNCRRANGLMMDSVYVVAFYTDNIAVSGGPESFDGLPGMILQVTLPYENITWLATKVTDISVLVIKIPSKGKVVNNKELWGILEPKYKGDNPYLKSLLF